MNKYWFQNPKVLLSNLKQFYPKKDLNKYEKTNALARLAIYLMISIYVLKFDMKYLSVSFTILLLSIFLGLSDNFQNTENDLLQMQ
jgi:uncharacterized membrane protein YbaN (DUF454 family)